MTTRRLLDEREPLSALGGRLPLVPPDRLDDAQRAAYDELAGTRVAHAARAGYVAVLPDGRLIGPFNALLRVPAVAVQQLRWATAVAAAVGAAVPAAAREIAILTVGAERGAEYVVYAHGIAAANAGVPHEAIASIVAGRAPHGLSTEASLVHRLAIALVRDKQVDDGLYDAVRTAFGEPVTVALTALIGQYLATCALLTCFQVPSPTAVG